MPTISARRDFRGRPRGFTLVEVLAATVISGFILSALLATDFRLARSGARSMRYAELEEQVREGLETLGADLRGASGFIWNSASDITLTVPDSSGTTAQVTYAWTSATGALFRVPGASSTATAGRVLLITGVPTATDGTPGVVFGRLDASGNATVSDASTKQIRIYFTALRSAGGEAGATRYLSSIFALRNKPAS